VLPARQADVPAQSIATAAAATAELWGQPDHCCLFHSRTELHIPTTAAAGV